MKRKITTLVLVICFIITNISFVGAQNVNNEVNYEKNNHPLNYEFSDEYGIQWEMNFGSNIRYGARYEGPQPIGDCDNDGLNELLVGGRDSHMRIFEWDETNKTYFEMHTLHCPRYPLVSMDADGFAIGDLTGDGENEIAVSWYATIHKWIDKKYEILDFNTWLEDNGGGSPDCYIGDCDNDGQNEFILSCRYWTHSVPEIVVFEWNDSKLVKVAEWDDPGVNGIVFMAGLGDTDYDGENEIVCGSENKVVVLDWDKAELEFDATIIDSTQGWQNYPFACVCKDSDMDGQDEIHIGYHGPRIKFFEWDGQDYQIKYEKEWIGEGALIEGLDVGDVDCDNISEVCAGTDVVHILQWNGSTYVEEAVLPTFGELAVLNIGDCDNDGKNEIHAGSVIIHSGQDFMSWIFKYGLEPLNDDIMTPSGSLDVTVKSARFKIPLNGVSVAAWNLETRVWYDIGPKFVGPGSYYRSNLPVGEYLLRAVIEDYEIKDTTVNISDGEVTSYTFYLQPDFRERNSKDQGYFNPFLQFLKGLTIRYPLLEKLFGSILT
jgi:hypothetical protein